MEGATEAVRTGRMLWVSTQPGAVDGELAESDAVALFVHGSCANAAQVPTAQACCSQQDTCLLAAEDSSLCPDLILITSRSLAVHVHFPRKLSSGAALRSSGNRWGPCRRPGLPLLRTTPLAAGAAPSHVTRLHMRLGN